MVSAAIEKNGEFGHGLVPGLISLRILDEFKYFFYFNTFGIFLSNNKKKWDLTGYCSQILEYTRHLLYRENWSRV